MDERALRLECVRLVINQHNNADAVIKEAEKLYQFVIGKPEKENE